VSNRGAGGRAPSNPEGSDHALALGFDCASASAIRGAVVSGEKRAGRFRAVPPTILTLVGS
jgi:hypothetical protein